MKDAGVAENDTDLMTLQKRAERLEKEAARLRAKAPSLKPRRLALMEAQDAYQKTTLSQKEFAEKVKAKALKREEER